MRKLNQEAARWAAYLFVALMATAFYACDDDDDGDDDQTPIVSEQDENFAVEAAYINLSEIELGQLAVSMATHDSVLAFAQMMIDDHTDAQDDLESIAVDLNIELPDTVKSEHKALREQLDTLSGFQFDSVYIHHMVLGHEEAQDVMQTQIDDGENEELTNYASAQLTAITMHLQEAMDTETEVNEEGDGDGNGEGDGDGLGG